MKEKKDSSTASLLSSSSTHSSSQAPPSKIKLHDTLQEITQQIKLENKYVRYMCGVSALTTFNIDNEVLLISGTFANDQIKLWQYDSNQTFNYSETLSPCSDVNCFKRFTFNNVPFLACAGFEHTIELWNLSRKTRHAILSKHTDSVCALEFYAQDQQNYLISASYDAQIYIWDLSTNTTIHQFSHLEEVTCLSTYSLTLDSKFFLASGSKDESIRIWDLNSLTFCTQLKQISCPIETMTISDEKLISTMESTTIGIWSLLDYSLIYKINNDSAFMIFSLLTCEIYDKNYLVCAFDDQIKVWDLDNKYRNLSVLEDFSSTPNCLTFYQNQTNWFIISGHRDGSIVFWSDSKK